MLRQLAIFGIALSFAFALDLADAEAARRGGFFRRARATRTTNYRTTNSRAANYRTRSTQKSSSQKLHMTHSRSAILDGFFGPYPGAAGHDRSWYVGK